MMRPKHKLTTYFLALLTFVSSIHSSSKPGGGEKSQPKPIRTLSKLRVGGWFQKINLFSLSNADICAILGNDFPDISKPAENEEVGLEFEISIVPEEYEVVETDLLGNVRTSHTKERDTLDCKYVACMVVRGRIIFLQE